MINQQGNGSAPFPCWSVSRILERLLAPTAFYFALAAAVTYPQIRLLDHAIPNMVDGYFNIWRLAWFAHQLPRHPLELFQANIFYPERYTLALSDALLVPGLLAAPFFWLHGNPVLIYNVVFLSAFALSGTATYLLVRELTGSHIGALVAGAFFVWRAVPLRSLGPSRDAVDAVHPGRDVDASPCHSHAAMAVGARARHRRRPAGVLQHLLRHLPASDPVRAGRDGGCVRYALRSWRR